MYKTLGESFESSRAKEGEVTKTQPDPSSGINSTAVRVVKSPLVYYSLIFHIPFMVPTLILFLCPELFSGLERPEETRRILFLWEYRDLGISPRLLSRLGMVQMN